MPRNFVNKKCQCGRPAVAWTAGDYACVICDDIQRNQVEEQRSEKLKALCKVHPSRRRDNVMLKYSEPFRVAI